MVPGGCGYGINLVCPTNHCVYVWERMLCINNDHVDKRGAYCLLNSTVLRLRPAVKSTLGTRFYRLKNKPFFTRSFAMFHNILQTIYYVDSTFPASWPLDLQFSRYYGLTFHYRVTRPQTFSSRSVFRNVLRSIGLCMRYEDLGPNKFELKV